MKRPTIFGAFDSISEFNVYELDRFRIINNSIVWHDKIGGIGNVYYSMVIAKYEENEK